MSSALRHIVNIVYFMIYVHTYKYMQKYNFVFLSSGVMLWSMLAFITLDTESCFQCWPSSLCYFHHATFNCLRSSQCLLKVLFILLFSNYYIIIILGSYYFIVSIYWSLIVYNMAIYITVESQIFLYHSFLLTLTRLVWIFVYDY